MKRIGMTFIVLSMLMMAGCETGSLEHDEFIPVSLNHKSAVGDTAGDYSLLVMGHIYGKPDGGSEEYLSGTLISSIPMLVEKDPDFIVLLGDSISKTEPDYLQYLNDTFILRFDNPVLSAFGNHDKSVESLEYFGIEETYYSLLFQNAQIIVLDTNLDHCNVSGEQLDFLKQVLEEARENQSVEYVLVFMHHTIFINDDDLYNDDFFMTAPNRWECYDNTNYPELFEQFIKPVGMEKPVYLFAGDVGAFYGNLSPYYFLHPDSNVTEIATGLGDHDTDNAVLLTFNEANGLNIEVISLAGIEMMPIEWYTKDYYLHLSEIYSED